jgi:hypothetical protein
MPAFRSFVRAVFLLSVLAGLSSPAKSQTASPTTTIRVTSDLVYLDVTVLDRNGNPVVTGLTKNDFTITEDGKPQRIFSFDTPTAGTETTAGASPVARPETVQVPDRKTAQKGPATILVLDLMNTPFSNSAYARDSIRRYLDKQPQRLASPTELMVLNNTALNIVQPYTHNREDAGKTRTEATPFTCSVCSRISASFLSPEDLWVSSFAVTCDSFWGTRYPIDGDQKAESC